LLGKAPGRRAAFHIGHREIAAGDDGGSSSCQRGVNKATTVHDVSSGLILCGGLSLAPPAIRSILPRFGQPGNRPIAAIPAKTR